jgi:signal transduction histidine kinase
MEQMITTLLDFTQLRFRGTLALALERCDVERLARVIVDELRAAHPGRAITLEAGGELCGHWDAGRVGRVLSNLVGNALTHGDGESPVALCLTADADAVFIAVTNRGPTIPGDVRGKLFEPFWQGAPDGTPRSRGLGLGQFIVQQIVHAHRGTIAVRSEDGETTFTVRLPR